MTPPLEIAPEVAEALAAGRPVVALESTILTHGMPWPRNLEMAQGVEADAERMAQVVVYRRPLEHRAASRRGLRILVYRTIVEQLSALTGRPVSDFDAEADLEE